jgi:ABC-type taurine transport system ATPase subunit
MLHQIIIRRFKRFEEVEIELGNPVVFVGPNNSGKTSALQALALWSIGIRKWIERRGQGQATKRTGVTINRRELISIPLLNSYALWRELRVRKGNQPIRIDIILNGVYGNEYWTCGVEFESVDPENIRCRPIVSPDENDKSYRVPEGALHTRIAFLPPMSGLVSQEDLLQPGSIERRIGEGRTADVLRNLCYQVFEDSPDKWARLKQHMKSLFGVTLLDPEYDRDTGILSLSYEETNRVRLDLTASGQGFRQTLLLLTYLYVNPNTILLLDEPDAHLEILRQQQIYQTLGEVAAEHNNQIVIATHSEVILNEAAQRKDTVIAFIGHPHSISKTTQVQKALAKYGYEHYFQAEQIGWVLYLEGSSDLVILQTFAKRLNHPAQTALERPFTHYVANQPGNVEQHFFALREAFPQLIGVALFDQLDKELEKRDGLLYLMWNRREIENYFAFPQVLVDYALAELPTDLFGYAERQRRQDLMKELIKSYIPPIALEDLTNGWWQRTKLSDDFLDPLFADYYARLGLPNDLRKKDYYRLAEFVPLEMIVLEVREKLDGIAQVATQAPQLAPLSTEEDDSSE